MNKRQKKKMEKRQKLEWQEFFKFLQYCLDNDITNIITIDQNKKKIIFEKSIDK